MIQDGVAEGTHDAKLLPVWPPHEQFFRFFIPAYQAGLTPEAIRRTFKNCGIYPCDRNVEKLKNIGPSTVFDKYK